MGTFVGQPSVVDLLSSSQDLEYSYNVTVAKATSLFAPAVRFSVSINSALYEFDLDTNAFIGSFDTGTDIIYSFKINIAKELRNYFKSTVFFDAATLTTVNSDFQFTVSVEAIDYLPDSDGILSPQSPVLANDITVINATKKDVTDYKYTTLPIDLMTDAKQYQDIIKETEFKIFVYGTSFINSVEFKTYDENNVLLEEGTVLLTNVNNINVLNLRTDLLHTYSFIDGSISVLDDSVKFIKVTAGNWDGIRHTSYSIDRFYTFIWKTCNFVALQFQNTLGTIDTYYFKQFDVFDKTKTERYYKANVGNRKLSSEVTQYFDVVEETINKDTALFLNNIYNSSIFKLTYESETFEVVIETEKDNFINRFDNSYTFNARFEKSENSNTFNN